MYKINVAANFVNVIPDWGEIQLDCSVANTLTVNYSKNLAPPDHIKGDIYERILYEMFLKCKGQVCLIITPCLLHHFVFNRVEVQT